MSDGLLESDKYLGPSERRVYRQISHYYCEINMLHPFISGNGVAQWIFFEQLAIHAGYVLNSAGIDPDDWAAANQSGAMGGGGGVDLGLTIFCQSCEASARNLRKKMGRPFFRSRHDSAD